jgi:hypothetical protein
MQGLHLVAKRLVGVWKGRILGDTLIALFSLSGSWKISRKPIDKDHKEVAVSYVCARKKGSCEPFFDIGPFCHFQTSRPFGYSVNATADFPTPTVLCSQIS